VNAAGLFLMLVAEFLAMILIVVYVGAVAVLFLFVIMMLDVDFAELKQGFLQYLPIGVVVGACVFFELLSVLASWVVGSSSLTNLPAKVTPGVSNTLELGRVIYTQYAYLFEASGLILLTAMIGAIVLTLRHKQGVKRQVISEQNARNAMNAIEVRKVASRQGI
jgi:NADH-quinone oxidoreductase subunit J